MKRYERVNLWNGDGQSLQNYRIHFQSIKSSIQAAATQKTPEDKRSHLGFALTASYATLLYYHFEIDSPPIKPMVFVCKAVNIAKQYFYCPPKAKRWACWNRAFYFGTLFSLLNNNQKTLIEIAEWVDRTTVNKFNNDHPFDFSTSATINYYSPLFYVFAQYFCGIPRNKYSKEINCIKNGNRTAVKTLLKIWESIDAQDFNVFEKLLVQLVNKHIKDVAKMKPPFNLTPQRLVSREATWMWNIALRSGMKMPELPEEIMDRIVTPQSIGLEK
jgi:hypothetical protein